MLNEERIILMTRMESYAENDGKKNMQIGNYFRSDYISIQVIKSVVSVTIAYGIGFALYVLYHLETFLEDIYKIDLLAFAKNVLLIYGVTVVIYGVISYLVYSYCYSKAKKSLKKYYDHLKKLNSLYRDQA